MMQKYLISHNIVKEDGSTTVLRTTAEAMSIKVLDTGVLVGLFRNDVLWAYREWYWVVRENDEGQDASGD